MSTDPKFVRDLFLGAAEMPALERDAFLADRCRDDPNRRAAVERLLAAHDQPASILNRPAPGIPTSAYAPITEKPGATIGPYKLMEQIGEGGFGLVFVAEQQEPVQRKVALKVIKPGMDSQQVIARFEAERQALAMMDHPNIARVLDAGTTDSGRPYFVMELVRGIPITEYCDQNRLAPRERLELFVTVCNAIQHAHQKGIIHRDVKPSNVLVTSHDGKPVAKVIDFGVAKAIHQRLTDRTIYTSFAQMIGTPLYMSPEQAEMSGLDIDTRSDIYSLGVLLYELLTGVTPLEKQRLAKAAYDEIRRLIRDDEPLRPSQRLSTSDTLPSVAACRNTDPARLSRMLRGEVDWIVMKSLEKDRTRRYETASGLARDVQRYLADEIVEARPPSTNYRLRKFVRRNKGPVVAGGVLLLTLLLGIAGTTFGLIQAGAAWRSEQTRAESEAAAKRDANEQRDAAVRAATAERSAKEQAQRRLAQIEKGVELFAGLVKGLNPRSEEQGAPPLYEQLRQRAAKAADDLVGESVADPDVVARLQTTLGDTLLGLGDAAKAITILERARATQQARLGSDYPDTLKTLHSLACAYQDSGKLPEAIALYKQVHESQVKVLGAEDRSTVLNLNCLASAYQASGRLPEAIALYEQVRDTQVKILGADHPDTLTTVNNIAVAYMDVGKLPESIALLEQVRDTQVKKLGADHPSTLVTLSNLATAYQATGKLPEAITLLEQVRDADVKKLGADHPGTLTTLNNLASAYGASGKLAEAIALLEHVRDASVKKLGAEHPTTLTTLSNLANAYREAGKIQEAIALYEQVRDTRVKILGSDHPATLVTLCSLAVAYEDAGRLPEAVALAEQVRDNYVKTLGIDNPSTLTSSSNLATMYFKVGKRREAVALFEQVRDADVNKLGADHPSTLVALNNLAAAYCDGGKLPEAVILFEQVRDAYVKKLGAEHPNTLTAMCNLARAYRLAGKLPEAIALLEQVRDAQLMKLGGDHPSTLITLDELAVEYWQAGKRPEAVALLEKVRDTRVKKLGPDHPDTLATLANLARAYRDTGRIDEAVPLFEQAAKGIVANHQFWRSDFDNIMAEMILAERQAKQFDKVGAWQRQFRELARRHANEGVLLSEKQPQGAVDHFTAAIAYLAGNLELGSRVAEDRAHLIELHRMKAHALFSLKRYDEAVKDWDRIIELDDGPNCSFYRLARARILPLAGHHEQAAAEAEAQAAGENVPMTTLLHCAVIFSRCSVACKDDAKLQRHYAERSKAILANAFASGFAKVARLIPPQVSEGFTALRTHLDLTQLIGGIQHGSLPKEQK